MNDLSPNLAWWQSRLGRRLRADLCFVVAIALAATPWLYSQTTAKSRSTTSASPVASPAASKVAAVKSFRIVQEKDGPAVEILSTKPLIPAIQVIGDPDRLVIDLPNARLDTQEKRISVQADQISTLRAEQFQLNPPVARVVVDLLAPRAYTWDAAGNRLVVHLGKNPSSPSSSPFQAPTVPSLTSGPLPVVTAVRSAGPLALTASDGSNGSSITAGPDTAILRLSSGGEVHVCPGTTVSVTPSQNRHNLLLSMNAGALEAHFSLDTTSDSVMTPDFRILLVGPGEFHYAISADNQGNTCVRALPGNTASAIVSELIGDRTYQVKATDQLVFRSGQLDRVDMAVPLECGCPPPRDPPMRATNDLPMQSQSQSGPTSAGNASSAPLPQIAHAETPPAAGAPAGAAAPDVSPAANDLHVQVSAPFVFRATGPPPPPVVDAKTLPLESRKQSAPGLAAPLPPPVNAPQKPAAGETASTNRPPARGFFRRIGGFFASLFH